MSLGAAGIDEVGLVLRVHGPDALRGGFDQAAVAGFIRGQLGLRQDEFGVVPQDDQRRRLARPVDAPGLVGKPALGAVWESVGVAQILDGDPRVQDGFDARLIQLPIFWRPDRSVRLSDRVSRGIIQ